MTHKQRIKSMGGSEEEELKLLGTKLSPFSHRIEWALKLKGIQYEFVREDLKNKSSLLLLSNPVHKRVPVLIHGEKVISESLVILEYIDETWKDVGNPILPKDPLERAKGRFLAKFVDEELFEASKKALYSKGEDQEKALESMAEALEYVEGETRANGRNLFGGEEIGYVDIVLGLFAYWFGFAEEAAGLNIIDSSKYPALASWINIFLNVPLIRQNLPPPAELQRVCHLASLNVMSAP